MRRGVLVAIALLGLAGCATGPREVPGDREEAWRTLEARLEALDRWRAEGRLSVRMGGDGGQARFSWTDEAGAGFRLRLEGPWGSGAARLAGGNGSARLTTGEGRDYAGADARALLAAVYGWDIPVAGLRRWLIGLPADAGGYTLDRFGRLATLESQGWRIEYRRYRQVGDLDLPAVLRARRVAGETEVRVVVDEWYPGGGDSGAPAPESPIPLIGD